MEATKLFREAIKENCKVIAKNENMDQDEVFKTLCKFVDEFKNGGFVLPTEFYRLVYNESIECLPKK
tara:strand:+ start:1798 stop:1998 length:201 start_codon:yes stop_codon:yes gene_type:complete